MIIFSSPLQICHLERGNWCLNLRWRVIKRVQTTPTHSLLSGSEQSSAGSEGELPRRGKIPLLPLDADGLGMADSFHSLDDTRLNKDWGAAQPRWVKWDLAPELRLSSANKKSKEFSEDQQICLSTLLNQILISHSLGIPKHENNTTMPRICYKNNCF